MVGVLAAEKKLDVRRLWTRRCTPGLGEEFGSVVDILLLSLDPRGTRQLGERGIVADSSEGKP